MTLKPIQTRYKGHHFRSRLEARYAVFLDHLGVQWQYEPEGFELSAGRYLPDFFLPAVNGGTWLEIKPHGGGSFFGFASGGRLEDPRLEEFADQVRELGQSFYVAYGIPAADLDYNYDEGMLEAPWDPHHWCVCSCGQTVGIQFEGRGDRIRCPRPDCCASSHGDRGHSYDHSRIVVAAQAARSARFERGETPSAPLSEQLSAPLAPFRPPHKDTLAFQTLMHGFNLVELWQAICNGIELPSSRFMISQQVVLHKASGVDGSRPRLDLVCADQVFDLVLSRLPLIERSASRALGGRTCFATLLPASQFGSAT